MASKDHTDYWLLSAALITWCPALEHLHLPQSIHKLPQHPSQCTLHRITTLLQVKIAELPLDCFRMLQALEWEDAFCSANPPAAEHPMPIKPSNSDKDLKNSKGPGAVAATAAATAGKKGASNGVKGGKGSADKAAAAAEVAADTRSVGSGSGSGSGGAASLFENPSKHLVYRPSATQLLSILTTTMEVLPRDGVLLLYLSALSGGKGADLKTGGAFSSTSNLMAGEGGAADGDGPLQDNMSDVSALSIGALTVANSTVESGLNLGPSKAQVRGLADSEVRGWVVGLLGG